MNQARRGRAASGEASAELPWHAALGQRALEKLARKYGTPLYLYAGDVVRARCAALRAAFPRAEVRYAMKANDCPALLALVRAAGLGVETVSPWEVRLAREMGFKKRQVICSANNPSDDDLRALARAGITVNLDALSALARWGKIAPKGARVGLRVNLQIGGGHHKHVVTGGPDSKFGLAPEDLPRAREIAAERGFAIVGLHQHLGSGLTDIEVFRAALDALFAIVPDFPDVTFVDIGGGFAVPIRPGDAPLDLARWGEVATERFAALEASVRRPLAMLIEPGRYVVAESGVLLTRVTTVKRARDRVWIGVDTGMHHLVRPAMYGAYHPVAPVRARAGTPERCFVVGPICESGDVLAEERTMVPPEEGDLLAIGNAGAYGYVMASRYNLRARPAEIVLDGGKARLARARDEYRDLVPARDVRRAR
jgi:diaminopimelate decarboxylase